jgi:hypothetical protein
MDRQLIDENDTEDDMESDRHRDGDMYRNSGSELDDRCDGSTHNVIRCSCVGGGWIDRSYNRKINEI